MRRIPNRSEFTANAVKAVLEISEGTLYEMIRTGEIWEPTLDNRGRNVWSFEAVAECCVRQIDRWLNEDVFDAVRSEPSRRCPHSREELDDLRTWISAQEKRRRVFPSYIEALEWDDTCRDAERKMALLQSADSVNQKQRIGQFFGWLREEGVRACRLAGLEPFGPPDLRSKKD
jgi:hypothetical protein